MSPSTEENPADSPTIRLERPSDTVAIHRVHVAAFPSAAEAELVDALRRDGDLVVSLVAELDGSVVGHVALSPVTLDGQRTSGVGLAPLAVLPEFQRQGIGALLVEAGLATSAKSRFSFVVVLGEPTYYGRFGFRAASDWRLDSEYAAGDAFMARPLAGAENRNAAIRSTGMPCDGRVRYADAFAALG